jgi:protein-disulfide isomerase
MKIIASAALAAVTVLAAFTFGGCQHQAQPLETLPARKPAAAAPGPAAPVAGSPVTPAGTAAPDRSGTLEDRMARIEDALARNAEALEFLNKVYAQQKAAQAQQDDAEPAPDAVFAVDVSEDVQGGQVDGPATAAVTIVKAFDFACPYCRSAAPTMDALVKDYNGKVRVVYTNMVIHPPARPAHLASCAAAKQGKYKQFKDAFWDKGYGAYAASHDLEKLGEDNIVAIAKDLGLDTAKLKADMTSPACAARLEHDQQQMVKFHVNATPTFFINGKLISGALPKDEFKQLIDDQLAIVAHSGVPAAQYYGKVVIGAGEKQFRSKTDPRPTGK